MAANLTLPKGDPMTENLPPGAVPPPTAAPPTYQAQAAAAFPSSLPPYQPNNPQQPQILIGKLCLIGTAEAQMVMIMENNCEVNMRTLCDRSASTIYIYAYMFTSSCPTL